MRDWIPNPTGVGGQRAGEPSRNPLGRPLGAQQIQNKALELCGEALDVLAEIMRGRADKSIVSAQIAACSLILDRGCGRAINDLADRPGKPQDRLRAAGLRFFTVRAAELLSHEPPLWYRYPRLPARLRVGGL